LSARATILIVDDEPSQRQLLQAILGETYEVVPAADGEEARQLLDKRAFDLVVTDDRMPGMSGTELVQWAAEHCPETPFVVLTAHGSIETAVRAMKNGARDYLTKPLASPEELRLVVDKALRTRRIEQRSAALEADAEARFPADVIAESTAMKELLGLAEQVASQPTTVLLTGESGTGKEVVARFIHRRSGRTDGPFVAVNCAALTETLLESEMFGHEKGAFTGATEARRGRFELAHGGTLFLDEISEMGANLQAKLLRVLEERELERVGGTRTVAVDVRVIAATNRDPETAVAEGALREDLYYRLNVFPLRIPPLRERKADVLPLAEHFARRISRRMGRPVKPFDAAARDAVCVYDWPGNVRELQNAVERALIVARGDVIRRADLPFMGDPATPAEPATASTLADLERRAILAALDRNDGNRRATADELGISLRTLQYRLKEYGVTGSD